MTSEELSSLVVKGMEEKKAEDVSIMDLRNVKGAVSDFFVLCSGSSDTQLESIAESIEKEVKNQGGETPWRKEGFTNKEWILIDYVNVVAHIFKKNQREFYDLEDLWGDARITSIAQSA